MVCLSACAARLAWAGLDTIPLEGRLTAVGWFDEGGRHRGGEARRRGRRRPSGGGRRMGGARVGDGGGGGGGRGRKAAGAGELGSRRSSAPADRTLARLRHTGGGTRGRRGEERLEDRAAACPYLISGLQFNWIRLPSRQRHVTLHRTLAPLPQLGAHQAAPPPPAPHLTNATTASASMSPFRRCRLDLACPMVAPVVEGPHQRIAPTLCGGTGTHYHGGGRPISGQNDKGDGRYDGFGARPHGGRSGGNLIRLEYSELEMGTGTSGSGRHESTTREAKLSRCSAWGGGGAWWRGDVAGGLGVGGAIWAVGDGSVVGLGCYARLG
ncbi:hypothetical protein SETIT_7G152000v2 [Setaria italica]|uniref:Uncharacterized protein n=1 Tax=Setaria italica TaxID=4555 RepID=A0A368RVU8_SETIT|nr:hypothetical protein SETIT_7G152000v2 [Setaria italica]